MSREKRVRSPRWVAQLGGEVAIDISELGALVVSGLDDAAAAQLAADKKVKSLEAEVELQLVPQLADMQWSTQEAPPGTAPAGHDPTTASFFSFQWDMQIIDADDAWNAGFNDASGVRVAILDTGIDPSHQDLAGRVDAASSIAFTPSLNPAGPVWGDDHFHGTHVAGTVSTNGIGTSGVAPHATLIAVKVCDVFGGCSTGALVAGLVHAANVGADIVNMSLSGAFPKAGLGTFVGLFNRAVNFANQNGVVVVSAAGNQAEDLQHNGNFVRFPCESGAGVCVSATGPTDAPAGYTNFGTSAISVAGPGGDFNGDASASMVLAPCSTLSLVIPICGTSPTFYVFVQGTSMATPHVAGAAALLDAQSGGGMNAGQLKSSLQNTADDLGKKGADPFFGKGRINVGRLLGAIP